MKYRRLGRSGPQVSAVSQGRGATPINFGDPLEAEFNAAIHRALDLGINFFDSSDAYWGTRHEVLLGRALKGRRNQALITSKFGNIDLPDGKKGTNGRPEYVFECCDASLKRLGVDVIDVYYLHRVDPARADRRHGRRDGASSSRRARCASSGSAKRARKRSGARIASTRSRRSRPSIRCGSAASKSEILPACRELGVGYVAFAPLGRGLLTGRIKSVDDLPRERPPAQEPALPAGEPREATSSSCASSKTIAAAYDASPAQVALAWLLAQGDDIVPIPGTNHAANVEQNAAAAELALREGATCERLSEIFAPGAGAGERFPPHILKTVGL